MPRLLLHAGALLCALLLAVLVLPACAVAAEISLSGAYVTLPWGDLLIEAAKVAIAVIVPSLVGWIGVEIARLFPALRKILTDRLIDRMVRLAADFALASLEGCAKGRTVPVNLGAPAVAIATQRAMQSTQGWIAAQAGGAQGIAERVFRHLDLEPGASNDNTLTPALVRLGVPGAVAAAA